MSKNRNYSFKDVDMLLTSKTIAENFKLNLPELSSVRSVWTEEFGIKLSSSVDTAIDNYLGLDKKKELRQATAKLSSVQIPAIRDLSFLKQQLTVDFVAEKPVLKEILKNLGFAKFYSKVQKSDQESLIGLLFAFKKGMDDSLKAKIVEKGTNPELIDRIIGYANQMLSANLTQETQKEVSKEVSEEAIIAFNEIYTEIIGVCKIARAWYQYDPLKKDMFNFSKVLRNMNASAKAVAEV